MKIIDRYLVLLFAKVLVVCFVSLVGLLIVVDMFANLDELWSYGRRHEGGFGMVLAEYYGPRCLQFFDKTAGILAMISVVFVISILQRTNEMTALVAAGISRARVLLPLMLAACFVSWLGVANREFGLPRVRASLARNAQDWMGDHSKKCTPKYDLRTDILISGKSTLAKNRKIEEPLFRLPTEFAAWGRQISADAAYEQPANSDHPAGYLLRGVKLPANLPQLTSQKLDEQIVLYSPADSPWLKPDECFVASVVTFEQLTIGGAWKNYLSSYELVTGIRGRVIEPGADVRVTLHARLVQPLLDFSLVLLGLPLVLTHTSRNIFLAAGRCGGMVALLYFVMLTCHGLGSNYLLDPTLAAWIPLVVFGPVAFAWARPIWD